MRYSIEIKTAVNYHTKAAEVSVVDHTYDGKGRGIVVGQKHIGFCDNTNLAESASEDVARRLYIRLKAVCVQELSAYENAKP